MSINIESAEAAGELQMYSFVFLESVVVEDNFEIEGGLFFEEEKYWLSFKQNNVVYTVNMALSGILWERNIKSFGEYDQTNRLTHNEPMFLDQHPSESGSLLWIG